VSEAKLVFIGGGNMATSLIGGLIEKGYSSSRIIACDPVVDSGKRLAAAFGITTHTENTRAASEADIIILAVKPQVMKTVASDLSAALAHKPLVISIAAGITATALQGWLGAAVPIIRCMPNTPALVQSGASGLFATALVTPEQRQQAGNILAAVGTVSWLDSEDDIDKVTALSGSGPAYFFLVIEAMTEAGIKLGLDPETARQLTLQTALGAARMAAASDVDAGELRKRVTSPAGTTEKAINSLLANQLPEHFEQAIAAAYDRAKEMADELTD